MCAISHFRRKIAIKSVTAVTLCRSDSGKVAGNCKTWGQWFSSVVPMKPIMISLPCSLVVALFVSRIGLSTLELPGNPQWLFFTVILCTILLYRRSIMELGVIAALTAFAQLNATGFGGERVSEDMLLAVLITIILLPTTLRIMDIHVDVRHSG
jgi:hypothetical protein